MLTKTDEKTIKKIFQEGFIKNIGDFFEGVLAPYLQGEFDRIDARLKKNDEDHNEIFLKLDRNRDEHDRILLKMENHEKRIKKVEKTLHSA